VYHWPPVGSPTCWTGSRHYGDADLVGWIDQHRPDIVLSGHVHQPPSKPGGAWADRIGDTWVFNPGKQSGPIPTHIELDIEPGPGPTRGTARWWSIMGSEEIDLSSPVTPPRTVF
jgi:Icc-related predicted phosphoesterase